MNDTHNILLMSDSYKCPHAKAYKKGIQVIYSYLESRGGVHPEVVFFGLQYYIKKYLMGVQVTKAKIDEAEKFWKEHFGRDDCFNRAGWEFILKKCGGKLPIRIRAVPEGMVVPVSNVLVTIENTAEECYWLTNYVETLLVKLWYSITIATQSQFIKRDIVRFLEKSGDPAGANFKVHDFGYRGVAAEEMAEIGAASHLLSFMGTDTVAGIRFLQKYYKSGMCGFSIPATEHSIMCSFGREGEVEACENFLNVFPTGLIACVSDTYDIYNCCENIWGGVLRDKVLQRDGCLVIRPDSGDFFEVIPKVLDILGEKFGYTVNAKGYKVLDPHVRVIQGDGMNPTTIRQLYEHIMKLGWSADNMAVGSGGGLLQQVNRDTQKFAFKCSAAVVDQMWIDVYKEPVTDTGKRSKKGRLKLIQEENLAGQTVLKTVTFDEPGEDLLVTVFEDGELIKEYTLDEIKKNMETKMFNHL